MLKDDLSNSEKIRLLESDLWRYMRSEGKLKCTDHQKTITLGEYINNFQQSDVQQLRNLELQSLKEVKVTMVCKNPDRFASIIYLGKYDQHKYSVSNIRMDRIDLVLVSERPDKKYIVGRGQLDICETGRFPHYTIIDSSDKEVHFHSTVNEVYTPIPFEQKWMFRINNFTRFSKPYVLKFHLDHMDFQTHKIRFQTPQYYGVEGSEATGVLVVEDHATFEKLDEHGRTVGKYTDVEYEALSCCGNFNGISMGLKQNNWYDFVNKIVELKIAKDLINYFKPMLSDVLVSISCFINRIFMMCLKSGYLYFFRILRKSGNP